MDLLEYVSLAIRAQPYTIPVFIVTVLALLSYIFVLRKQSRVIDIYFIFWLLSFGVFISVTATPTIPWGTSQTPLHVAPFASSLNGLPLASLISPDPEKLLNGWILAPGGFFAVMVKWPRLLVLTIITSLSPFVIELGLQRFKFMGRSSQLDDLAANFSGLLVGLALGLAFRRSRVRVDKSNSQTDRRSA